MRNKNKYSKSEKSKKKKKKSVSKKRVSKDKVLLLLEIQSGRQEFEQPMRCTSQVDPFNWLVRLVHLGILVEQPPKLLEYNF